MTIQLGRRQLVLQRGFMWLIIMIGALLAFELFNFSTTEYALGTFFGPHDALGLASWATVLSLAFCGIDFAGLSRLFTPQTEWHKEPKEVRFLTGAWLLGASMNATMTWWAVASALSENPILGNELVTRDQIINIVPLFVALLVWLTRVMLIGSIATAGDRLGVGAGSRPARPGSYTARSTRPSPKPAPRTAPPAGQPAFAGAPAATARSPLPEPATATAAPARASGTSHYSAPRKAATSTSRASTTRTYRSADDRPAPRRYDTPQRAAQPAAFAGGSSRAASSSHATSAAARSPFGSSMSAGVGVNAMAAPSNELTYVDLDRI